MLKKETNPDIATFINYATTTYERYFNEQLHINGRCAKTIQRLLSTFSLDKLQLLWDKFLILSERDEFIMSTGCSVPVFESVINKLTSGGRKKRTAMDALTEVEDRDDDSRGEKDNVIPIKRIS